MATLLDISLAYHGHSTMLQRIQGSCLKKAGAIRSEDVGTTNHANRLIWAKKVEGDPEIMAKQLLGRVVGNPTIAAQMDSVGDGTIDSVLDNLINTFADGT